MSETRTQFRASVGLLDKPIPHQMSDLDMIEAQLRGLAEYGAKYKEPQYIEAMNDAITIVALFKKRQQS